MHPDEDLWRLEEAFWTSGRDSARATTAAGAIMVADRSINRQGAVVV